MIGKKLIKKSIELLVILVLTTTITLRAQNTYQYFQDVEVINAQGNSLRMPWAGGLNGVQYNMIDIDSNGTDELVAFDRSSNTVRCFFFINGNWIYRPGYENQFPTNIFSFLILRDFNNDGRKDLFTAGDLGITVYENISSNFELNWRQASAFLNYETLSGSTVNLQTTFNDYPYVADVDQDGDIDIFNFRFSGIESKINFYRNFSVEETGSPGLDDFRLVDDNWGDVEDCDCGLFAFGNDNCNENRKPDLFTKVARHAGGKSVFINDLNADGTVDLVLSHEECASLYFFEGQGTENLQTTNFTSFTPNYPQNEPAQFNFYPNMMRVKADPSVSAEGFDLIVSPNLEGNLGAQVNFKSSNYLYREGLNGNFDLVEKNFLQGEMIDHGYQASPAFTDVGQDGLEDLLIAYTHLSDSGGLFSSIAYYQNTGTSDNPAFTLVTEDYLSLSTLGLANLHIQMKDINLDGELDLMLQATENNVNKLYFLYGDKDGLNLNTIQEITDISIGFGFNLHLADVVGDQKPDMLVGKSSGGLILYENIGSGSQPAFSRLDESFLGISDDFFRARLRVLVDDIDNDNEQELLTSDQSGILRIYQNPRDFKGEVDSLDLYNDINQQTNSFYFGRSNILSSNRLFDTSYPSLVIGTLSGGVQWLRNTKEFPIQTPPNALEITVYPNPSSSGTINIDSPAEGKMTVSTVDGKVVYSNISLNAGANLIDLAPLERGLYILKFHVANSENLQHKILID